MANEWIKVELYGPNNDGEQRRYTVADGTQISKGTLLQLTDPRTASKIGTRTDESIPVAGVASMDKEANDGSTSISVWTNGIFNVVASEAITVGFPVLAAEDNKVFTSNALAQSSSGGILGRAEATATDLEVINVRLRL